MEHLTDPQSLAQAVASAVNDRRHWVFLTDSSDGHLFLARTAPALAQRGLSDADLCYACAECLDPRCARRVRASVRAVAAPQVLADAAADWTDTPFVACQGERRRPEFVPRTLRRQRLGGVQPVLRAPDFSRELDRCAAEKLTETPSAQQSRDTTNDWAHHD